jgi:hypothetical protein
MSDCSQAADCGCAPSNCPQVPPPYMGENPPAADGCQPSQTPTDLDCCDSGCGCDGSGGASPGPFTPNIPAARGNSPALNVANGNLYNFVSLTKGGAYAPPMRLTYNSGAGENAIQYGAGVAGLYNSTLEEIDTDNIKFIAGDGSTKLYSDYDSGSGYYEAPAAGNALRRTSASTWEMAKPDGLK